MNDVLVDLGAVPVTEAVSSVVVPRQGGAEPPPGEPEFGKASPVALVVILLLGLATAFLIRSMTRHLKKVPASFDPQPSEQEPTDGDAAGPKQP
ncbi:hypothetical protein [Pseudonocardia abyssalis]|uniref:hypothetical protein n=1 Tax=Pseudonocardia abyssalis TaxID=2792008 RepID=UPI001C4A3C56|nr:hypothetical protein [Pseudonocardia abyssalis]